MTAFYTDVSTFKNKILLRGYDEENKRIQHEIAYRPYLFVPTTDKNSPYRTIRGNPVQKKEFDSIWEARQFIRDHSSISNFKIYGMEKFAYTFISDNFPGTVAYRPSKIRVMYIDIEVDTAEGMPDIETANRHINAITFKVGNDITVLGLKDFDPKKLTRVKNPQNVHYYKFKTEEALLESFLELWSAADPDVVSGWNIEHFDIPYIVRRLRQVLGDDRANEISPWKRLVERTIEIWGQEKTVYFPVGIAILDYLQLYQKFTYSQRESYSLNYISHVELNVQKIDYSEYEGLSDLYQKNHQLFIEYNIVDVELVYALENKLRLIELVWAIAYDAKVNYQDALGSVLLWDVLIMNYLMERNIVTDPMPKITKKTSKIKGAHVKEINPGMYKWVMSFDLTSLYPHLIMQYNISPETFSHKSNRLCTIEEQMNGEGYEKMDNCAIAANGCYYRKDKYGFLPALMDSQFIARKEYKDRMIETKKQYTQTGDESLKDEITRLDKLQHAKKIQLNSGYGALTNEYFRYFNRDNGEAVTLSGQLTIQWAARAINNYVNEILETKNVDYIIAMDTDSLYMNFGPLIEKFKPTNPVSFLDAAAKKMFKAVFEKAFDELADETHAYKNRMEMKREAICEAAIWRAKKNYAAYVWDNEGVRFEEPELKIMGLEPVRSSTPEICRNKIKEIILLCMTSTEEVVQNTIDQFWEEYKNLPFEDIAFPRSVKKLSKYIDSETYYKSKTPAHTKACITYNRMLKNHKLTKKYSLVYDADKIKWVYLKVPNPTLETVIGAPSVLPREFGLEKYIDYDLMFQKSFLDPVQSILKLIGWNTEEVNTLDDVFGL